MASETINQMEAVQVETGGIQTEADKVDIIDIQTEAGKVETSGVRSEADKVEISGIQTEADKVEISGIQTEADKVDVSDIQTEAAKVEISDIQMEAGKVEIGGLGDKTIETSQALADPSAQAEHFDSPKTEPIEASSSKKRKFEASTEDSLVNYILPIPGGTNCYPFKMRLQEYCDKAGLTSPVYETIIEGPSHEPSCRSTVIVDNVRYDSLPGFPNRKEAEHSAAEVALRELANSVDTVLGTSKSLHETGICFNMLEEYAQKMNYEIPLYECQQEAKKGKPPIFSCVVTIGGIKYAGASAATKKEAKIKATRTAMLAIQSAAASSPENQTPVNSVYAVIPPPPKKEVPAAAADELSKRRLKKLKRKQKKIEASKTCTSAEGTTCSEAETDSQNKEGPTAKAKPSRRILNKLRLEKRMQALETGTSGEGTTTCLEGNSESQLKIGATTSGEGTTPAEVVNADSQDILPVIQQEEKVPEVVFRNMGPTTEARTKRNRVKAENRKKKKKKQALKDGTSVEGTTSLEANDVEGPPPPTSAIKPKKRDFKNQEWKKKRQLFKNYAPGPPWMQPHHYLAQDFTPMTRQHHHHHQMEMQQPMRVHDGVSYHHMDERETDGISYQHMDEREIGYVTYPYVPPPANTIYENYY